MTPLRALVLASLLLLTAACGSPKKGNYGETGLETANTVDFPPSPPDLNNLAAVSAEGSATAILSALPGAGSELEDKSTGKRYRVQLDSIAGLPVDDSYQSSLGSGMYLVASNRHSFSFTDESLHDSVTYYMAQNTDEIDMELILTDTVSFDREVRLPNPNGIERPVTFNFTTRYANNTKHAYYLRSSDSTYAKLIVDGKPATRYYLDAGETISFKLSEGYWKSQIIRRPNITHIQQVKDWREHRFSIGDKATFGEERRPYMIVSGTYMNHEEGKEVNDGVFVFRVPEKVVKVPNLLQNSEQIVRSNKSNNVLNGWSFQNDLVEIVNNFTTGPQEDRNNATLLVRKGDPKRSNFIIRQTQIPTTAQLGDSITISFWAKAVKPRDRTEIQFRYDPGSKFISPPIVQPGELSDKEWRHFIQTFDLKTDPEGALSLSFRFSNSPGDSILFAAPKAEVYPAFTEYVQSVDVYQYGTGYVYAIPMNTQGPSPRTYRTRALNRSTPLFSGNVFNIDEYQFPDQYDTDIKQFRYAIELCQKNPTCKKIAFSLDKVWTDTLSVPVGMGILGEGEPTVTIDIKNPSKHAIFCENDRTYASYHRVSGINFEVVSPLRAVIYGNNGHDQVFEDNRFRLNYNADFGIMIGDPKETPRAIGSIIRGCSILESKKAGVIYVNCGNNHILDNVRSLRSKGWGIQGDVQQVFISGRNFETNEKGAFYFYDSGMISLTDTYCENATILIKSTLMFIMEKNRISGGDVILQKVEGARIANNRFASRSSITKSGSEKGEVEIINNWFQSEATFQTVRNGFDQLAGVTILHNYGDDWKQEQGKLPSSYFPRLQAKELHPERLTISDNLVLNGTVVTGIRENLINYSDSFAEGRTNTNFIIKTNAVPDQDGQRLAELFIGKKETGPRDDGIDTKEVLNGVVAGRTYVISQWVRDAKKSGSSNAELELSFGANKNIRLGKMTSKKWKQYTAIVKAEGSGRELVRRVRFIMPGDSLEFGRLQVNTGETVLAPVQTLATGIRDTSINLIVGGDQVLNIGGSMKIADSQILSAYAKSLKTPKAQQKRYSGFMSGFGNDGTQVEIPVNWDSSSGRTNANGQVVITHGLVSAGLSLAPDNIKLTDTSGDGHNFSISAINAQQFTVTVFSRGVPLRNGSYSFMWEAKAKAQ